MMAETTTTSAILTTVTPSEYDDPFENITFCYTQNHEAAYK